MRWWHKRWLVLIGLAIAASLIVVQLAGANQSRLPPSQIHPLPPSLVQWQATDEDYFSEIEPTAVGYLVWSEFPIKIYVERPEPEASAASAQRQQWVEAVSEAIKEWQSYLPLVEIEQPEAANIVIERSHPPRKVTINEDGLFDIPRARSAQTTYRFYLTEQAILSHRMLIQIRPGQSPAAALATARHELGHALGIWGHSPSPKDALYFSQVRNSPSISQRDINTLKKVYQQPTRLGWRVESVPDGTGK